MKIIVEKNGTQVASFDLSSSDTLKIGVAVDSAGEVLPRTTIEATGGTLDCYKSHLSQSGNIRVHLFGG